MFRLIFPLFGELSVDTPQLRLPWAARRSKKSILKEINAEYSLEELLLKLKLQYFGHLMQRTDSLEKTLILGEAGGEATTEDKMVGWHR